MLVPSLDCNFCPRLVSFRAQNKKQYPSYFNAPVPSFGSTHAQFLVVGLAPGLKGANQTGRPFTGDYAGLILYSALAKYGFTKGTYDQRIDDGFELVNCRVTNSVRCVPQENKPEPSEIKNCNNFLKNEIAAMKNLKVILSLGSVSHNAVLKSFGLKPSFAKFGHGAVHTIHQPPTTIHLLNTYHSSRYNINTGRLTQEMFDAVVEKVVNIL
jgi:uracil-DNA glycosylase family 4